VFEKEAQVDAMTHLGRGLSRPLAYPAVPSAPAQSRAPARAGRHASSGVGTHAEMGGLGLQTRDQGEVPSRGRRPR
jgi:hypothetical protein